MDKRKDVRILAFAAAAVCAASALAGCGAREASSQKQTETAVTERADPADVLPVEDFSKLPEDDEESLNYLSDAIGEAFPEVKGNKMYGFKGIEKVGAGSSERDCYIFDFYTYTKKTDEYKKIATVAQVPDTAELYVLDEQTGAYVEPVIS